MRSNRNKSERIFIIKKVGITILFIAGIVGATALFMSHDAPAPKAKVSQTTSETTPAKQTTESSAEALPDVSPTDWQLVLVSPEHKISKEVSANQLVTVDGGQQIDRRIQQPYEELVAAARKAGIQLKLISAFRSVSDQTSVFNTRVAQLMSRENLSEEAAKKRAMQTMTEPGYSEHHTGLAIDVVDQEWLASNPSMILDESYSEHTGAKWLQENARRFGFIVRYPDGKEAITKITYEPWHLRYVGEESAEYIEEHHITFEEFIRELTEK